MKIKLVSLFGTLVLLVTLNLQPSTTFAQGTAFSYQGRLNDGGSAATGIYDLRFTICDALTSGNVVAGPLTNSATGITNGLFAVTLDFGSGVFTGPGRWLEIAARTNGAASFTTLSPRQPVLPMPYAIMASSASNLLGNLPAAQLSGTLANGALPASPNFSGTVTASAFSGNGANLTSLNANNLASGTVPLAQLSGITSTQLAAAAWQLATNLNGGNAALATNVVSGIAITNAFITNSVFAGNGAGLSGLNPANLSAGTAGINISGNASTATSAASATTAGSATTATTANNFSGSLAGDVTGTQSATVVSTVGGQTAANVAGGASAANAATSANTAGTIVKRDASGNLSAGTISANLAGNATTATTAANVTGNVSDAQLSANIARLNGTNTFTGTNTLAGVLVATNAGNIFKGAFTGNGAGLTGVTAASLSIPPGMALIPAGAFLMGDNLDGETDAMPVISVTVSAFYMDVNLVSLSQWQSVYYWATSAGYGFDNAGLGKAVNHPVQTVNWYDCVKWCNARSQQAGLTPVYYTDTNLTQVYTNGDVDAIYANWTAKGYRLPTEAEWEKAARGGLSGQRFPWGNVITENLANYDGDITDYSYDLGPNGYNAIGSVGGTSPATSPVGSFDVNGYGLYDMAGNVFEWCWDWYGTPYGQPTTTNPTGPGTGSYRVVRGGNWAHSAYSERCAQRDSSDPGNAFYGIGFRCVRGL